MPIEKETDPVFRSSPASMLSLLDMKNIREMPVAIRKMRAERFVQPKAGSDGYTPIKGVDYFDGARGARGERGEKGDKGEHGKNGKDGSDGKDGKSGKDGVRGEKGEDGKAGLDADPKEAEKYAKKPVEKHEKAFDHSLLHNSYQVGTKTVDESDIADGKVLRYDKKKDKLVYREEVKKIMEYGRGGVGKIVQLNDVAIDGTPADNELLAWDTTLGKWTSQTAAEAGVLTTENDPVHTAWLATVTPANWNTAYGWGNHASAGYLTNITAQSIGNLSDVDLTGLADNHVLKYDLATTSWKPEEDNAPVSGSLTRTAGLLSTVTIGTDVHTLARTSGLVTGWESDRFIVGITRTDGAVTAWTVTNK